MDYEEYVRNNPVFSTFVADYKKDPECTCQEAPDWVRNTWHTQGCIIHCTHPGINTDGEWWCSCGASWED